MSAVISDAAVGRSVAGRNEFVRYLVQENVTFEVPRRFVILKPIGQGSYGYVRYGFIWRIRPFVYLKPGAFPYN